MDPVKLTIEIFIDEPVSNDIDELTDLAAAAIAEAIGEVDYVVNDVGLQFELNDS